ncbi:Uncharacterised protein [Mycobacteroides abscessus subsp. abscessus]|nr:Uncharacterised protein [Mycobacteroides abscessus subsp. abscessus]SIN59421.1 Uncharacterised protein [Mycobacteroides abscessus subsp. abscessus]
MAIHRAARVSAECKSQSSNAAILEIRFLMVCRWTPRFSAAVSI